MRQEDTRTAGSNATPRRAPTPKTRELALPRAISGRELLKMHLPPTPLSERVIYGVWTLANGDQVIFDRGYSAMYRRRPGEAAVVAEPNYPWDIVKEEFLWGDNDCVWRLSSKTQRRIAAVCKAWGIER